MKTRKFATFLIALAFGAVFSLKDNPITAQGLFSDESLTEKEYLQLEKSIEGSTQAIKAISELQILIIVQQLQNGDCEPVIEIDSSANQGNVRYQHLLASLYFDGVCVQQDNDHGIAWLTRASEAGRVEAQYELAQRYYIGQGTHRDLVKALQWLRQSGNEGQGKSQIALGQLYESGEGVVQDFDKAREWYVRAAENGELNAYGFLALLYGLGKLGIVDFNHGLIWALRGAEKGSEFSQVVAASIYADRKNPDLVEAHKWANLASQSNEPTITEQARTIRDQAENLLTGSQLLEAQHRASSWQPITDQQVSSTVIGSEFLDPRHYPRHEVQNVQENLLELGFDPGPIDGAWGPTTASAADEFEAHTISKMGISFKENKLSTAIKRLRSLRNGQPELNAIDGMTAQQAKAKLQELAVAITKDAYFEAVESDNLAIFRLFLVAGADIETRRGINSVTALFVAIDYGSDRIYRYLMEKNANVNVVSGRSGDTPLTRALSWERVDIAEELLDGGADASMHSFAERSLLTPSPLNYSLGLGEPSLVRRILLSGASTSERYFEEKSPLHFAVTNGDIETVKVLLEFGADVNSEDNSGETPLLEIIKNKEGIEIDMLELLLSHGSDPNAHGSKSLPPLLAATMAGNAEAVRLLTKFGSNPQETYRLERGYIPFGVQGDAELVDAMQNGATPLMVAARLNHISVVQQLLTSGASPGSTASGDLGDHSAISLAREKGNVFIVELIEGSM